MRPRHRQTLLTLLFLSAILGSAVFYPVLPDPMASHWGISGQADGYGSKLTTVLIGPIMLLVIALFMALIPHLDPLSENIKHFRLYYDGFWVALSAFIVYLHGLMLAWNIGPQFNMGQALLPGLAALWYYIGIFLNHAEPSWFIGIRTPWTLSDDRVWFDTHRMGSKLFRITAIAILVSALRPEIGYYVVLSCVLGGTALLIVYSYVAYRRYHAR